MSTLAKGGEIQSVRAHRLSRPGQTVYSGLSLAQASPIPDRRAAPELTCVCTVRRTATERIDEDKPTRRSDGDRCMSRGSIARCRCSARSSVVYLSFVLAVAFGHHLFGAFDPRTQTRRLFLLIINE